jgi:hypothetical protein
MWQYIVLVFLFLGSGYWIIKPLLHPAQLQDSHAPALNERIDQITLQKEATYATIKELEFDLNMGKLSEEDFEAMKKQYTLDALKYMDEIDQLQASKQGKTNPPAMASVFCTQCGKEADPKDTFCANCGNELKKD